MTHETSSTVAEPPKKKRRNWSLIALATMTLAAVITGRPTSVAARLPRRVAKLAGQRLLPGRVRRQLVRATRWPVVGGVQLEDLRRLTPISTVWGADRGLPVDRYYIEQFLSLNSPDIRGRVLEIGDNAYTRRFGSGVVRSDVLYHTTGNSKATMVLDLTADEPGERSLFDCIICTQTLQQIFDVPAALRTLTHLLKPGGTLLLTLPGISQIDRPAFDDWGDYWRMTTRATERLLTPLFPSSNVAVESHGNVLSAIAFLHGLAAEELTRSELDYQDPNYQLLLTARAVKA